MALEAARAKEVGRVCVVLLSHGLTEGVQRVANMPSNVITSEGRKFIWDGVDYPDGEQVAEKIQKYKGDGFEVEVFQQEGKTYLYTRRVVKEVIV